MIRGVGIDGSRLSRRSAGMTAELLPPGLERLLEGAFAGGALLDREDRAAPVVVDDRDVEPVALLEKLDVALHVGLDRREPDQEIARGDLGGGAAERRSAR